MLEHFADWHRDAGIEPNAETSPKHEKAIEEYRPDANEIISFARLFYGFVTQDDTSLAQFTSALRTADPTLSTRNTKQLQLMTVFAGSELIAVLSRDDDPKLADLAALSLVSGAAQGLRTALPVPEMPQIAARYIERRTGTRASTGAADQEGEAKVATLERELTIVSEETSMLWWLVSEHSRDRNASWKTVGALATPIIAGKELSDLTRVIPGPVAAAAFLDRIIRLVDSSISPKHVKVKEAIDKTPREWRERYATKPSAIGLEDLMPISNGLRLSLTVSEGDNWSPVFEKGTNIPASAKLAPNVLAYQTYLEHLLARLPGDMD